MPDGAMPATEAALAELGRRVSAMEQAVKTAEAPADRDGAKYLGLVEAANAMRDFWAQAGLLEALAREWRAEGRADLLAELAAAAEAARAPCQVIRLSG